jgi:hypothetical protein
MGARRPPGSSKRPETGGFVGGPRGLILDAETALGVGGGGIDGLAFNGRDQPMLLCRAPVGRVEGIRG